MSRSNHALNAYIESLIDQYWGTAKGADLKNMYENGTSYESICDYLGIDIDDYQD